MPLVSKGYILDIGIDEKDKSISLLFEKGQPLMCTLTHVDMSKNVNKFHVLHALHSSKGYVLYSRSGRTGNDGRKNFKNFTTAEECVKAFKSLFKELTANVWEFRDRFEHRMGYHAVFSYGEKTPDFVDQPESIPKGMPLALPSASIKKRAFNPKLDFLVELFCGQQTIKNSVTAMEIDYDATTNGVCVSDIDYQKMPVGMIAQRNLQMAKTILLEIQANLTDLTPEKITRYSERYYSYVPLKAARGHPPKLDNQKIISTNLDHIEDLSNITRTLELIEGVKAKAAAPVTEVEEEMSINEQLYNTMNHIITPLSGDDIMYIKICEFMKNSHGSSHHFKLTPVMIFEVLNSKQKDVYTKKYGNSPRKEMLVHGSRLCNWRSILEKGLLLDPTTVGAAITGKMFGNGIYWANSFSKSAQYCGAGGYTSRNGKETLCLAIAEVAVGNQLLCTTASQHGPSTIGGYDSVWGVGQNTPGSYYDHNGVHVPTGPLVSNKGGSLIYDEKIIYDQDQYYFRYLVIVERN